MRVDAVTHERCVIRSRHAHELLWFVGESSYRRSRANRITVSRSPCTMEHQHMHLAGSIARAETIAHQNSGGGRTEIQRRRHHASERSFEMKGTRRALESRVATPAEQKRE